MKNPRFWRRLRKIALWALASVLVLALILAGTIVWSVRRAFPEQGGTLALKGLQSKVTVLRDEWGVPQVYAANADDLYRAQGYLHAQDRFWEMDFRRHVTSGRVAELFGESQAETDVYLRTMGWRRVAEQEWGLISAEAKGFLTSYAEGVNAWLDANGGTEATGAKSLEYTILGLQNSGYTVEKWDPIDSLAWLKAMAWDLRGNMEAEIRRAALLAHGLSTEQVNDLYPAYPFDRNVPIVGGGDVVKGAFVPGGTSAPAGPAKAAITGSGPLIDALARGIDALPQLLGDGGPGIGSNSWVIGGGLTTTGKPLLANDPHLSPSLPGIWYQMGLHCECGLDVAGFTFSGVPGVVIGHNAKIAWGFTNLDPDVIDLYLERVEGDSVEVDGKMVPLTKREERIKVAGGKDRVITVRTSAHGPLLSDASEALRKIGASDQVAKVQTEKPTADGYAMALRWTALDPGKTVEALFALNRAADWTDFRAAAALFEVPAQNIVYADVDGNFGYQSPGRIPVRGKGDGHWPAPGWDSAYDWKGFIPFAELPSVLNPASGFIATANQAVIGPQYSHHLTDDWSYGYRSQRINDMIKQAGSAGKIGLDEIQRMQFDNRNGFAPTLVPHLERTAPTSAREAAALLKEWDFQQPESSAAAAYYNAVWKHLLILTFDELGTDYVPDGGDRWFEVVRSLLDKPESPWWNDRTTSATEKRDDILAKAQDAAFTELAEAQGTDPLAWKWGEMHTLTARNQTFGESGIGPIEWLFNHETTGVSGGDAIVNATGWSAGDGYEVDAVPSMRMIVNMAKLDDSRWIQLTGNSGHAFHANYTDQYEMWRTGQLLPFRFDRASIEKVARQTLTLTP
ncbi:penicillin amidase [Allocatelliglobosispora scoriae]|uniref:Penicillin amidase n=1 Tax=Allocatelliglobosispora scoriae TaxID=643052 RepID=A0A841BRU2_9ACTN|nr:penicillin acylase family protein [Allocatelliglobosispora scoriae]MBB5869520.1 penicillin amidase [Allocatelliglobosispora scoriae]